ncbi:MAG TPA: hypothetical protein VF746_14720 [Longimicrobium sp.]
MTTTTTTHHPASEVRGLIDAELAALRACTAGEFTREAERRRGEMEARVSALFAELLPEGVDPRFVSPASLQGREDDEVHDLLAAARWAADTADRSTYGGVCDGDAALDSVAVLEAELRARDLPVPAWS